MGHIKRNGKSVANKYKYNIIYIYIYVYIYIYIHINLEYILNYIKLNNIEI